MRSLAGLLFMYLSDGSQTVHVLHRSGWLYAGPSVKYLKKKIIVGNPGSVKKVTSLLSPNSFSLSRVISV